MGGLWFRILVFGVLGFAVGVRFFFFFFFLGGGGVGAGFGRFSVLACWG